MSETGAGSLGTGLDGLSPHQSCAGADGRRPLHARGLHGAQEVAGVAPGATGLRPHPASVPGLQDVVAGNQVMVSRQTEGQRAPPVVDPVVNLSVGAERPQVPPDSVGHGVGEEASMGGDLHRVDDGRVRRRRRP